MNFELRIRNLEKEIEIIKNRNRKVESDKAWETSYFRVLLICLITYLTTTLIFFIIKVDRFYITSVIPTVGFFLSVQTLPFIKKWWIKNRYNRN